MEHKEVKDFVQEGLHYLMCPVKFHETSKFFMIHEEDNALYVMKYKKDEYKFLYRFDNDFKLNVELLKRYYMKKYNLRGCFDLTR